MVHSIGDAAQHIVYGNDAIKAIDVPSTILLLLSAALVLFMVPGLGIFYGGLERRKNVSTIVAQSFISIPIVTIIWIFGGFSFAFGSSLGGVIGNPADYFLFRNVLFEDGWNKLSLVVNVTIANGVPFIAFFLFQLAFAIITPALVSGAFADRLNFRGYIIFNILFTLFVYLPVCHWIWGGGFLAKQGSIDWAGGVVIHVTCGAAAIASVIALKRRFILNYEYESPHSLPLTAIGAAILFFGWFGFNVGGATFTAFSGGVSEIQNAIQNNTILKENSQLIITAVSAFVNSFLSMCSAMLTWIIIDLFRNRHTSLLHILTSGVVGLATITPAAGFVPIWASLPIGLAGGVVCYLMCVVNHKLKFDDALEVWPVHGIGGLLGSLLVAGFATITVNPNLGNTQHLSSGQIGSGWLLLWQFIMILVVCAWTFGISIASFYLIIALKGKTTTTEQIEGLDKTLLNEYSYSGGVNKELRSQEIQKLEVKNSEPQISTESSIKKISKKATTSTNKNKSKSSKTIVKKTKK